MTKLSLSEDIYSRKSLKRSTSYENNQVEIDAFGFFSRLVVCDKYFVWIHSIRVVRNTIIFSNILFVTAQYDMKISNGVA